MLPEIVHQLKRIDVAQETDWIPVFAVKVEYGIIRALIEDVWATVGSDIWVANYWCEIVGISDAGEIKLKKLGKTVVPPIKVRQLGLTVMGYTPPKPRKCSGKETVEDFVRRGGTVTRCPDAIAIGAFEFFL
jgi:hypothetical protein